MCEAKTGRVMQIPGADEAVCAIGVFDGVHIGHRFLIEETICAAKRLGLPSVIVTFDIDPDELFKPADKVFKLLSNEDRLEMLGRAGADHLCVLRFDEAFASMGAEEFLDGCLAKECKIREIHVGSDFHFGAGGSGTVPALAEWGKAHGCRCTGHELKCSEGQPVHSSRIRGLLASGDVASAAGLLGREHFVRGVVEHGRGRGEKSFGIPTANVRLDVSYALPKSGVYAGYVGFGGMQRPAAINVGLPLSFKGARHVLEPHIVDFSGDIYGRWVTVSFTHFLREQMVFGSADELERVVGANIEWVRSNLSAREGEEMDLVAHLR